MGLLKFRKAFQGRALLHGFAEAVAQAVAPSRIRLEGVSGFDAGFGRQIQHAGQATEGDFMLGLGLCQSLQVCLQQGLGLIGINAWGKALTADCIYVAQQLAGQRQRAFPYRNLGGAQLGREVAAQNFKAGTPLLLLLLGAGRLQIGLGSLL